MTKDLCEPVQPGDTDWIGFPGGELEGRSPVGPIAPCRHTSGTGVGDRSRPLCFQCYRAALAHERALEAAGRLDTASEARFQFALPFEPVDRVRLRRLAAERLASHASSGKPADLFAARRRRAQMAARRILRMVDADLNARQAAAARRRMMAGIHAAELQLPESWLPFVVSG
jgi:hypothetical protein